MPCRRRPRGGAARPDTRRMRLWSPSAPTSRRASSSRPPTCTRTRSRDAGSKPVTASPKRISAPTSRALASSASESAVRRIPSPGPWPKRPSTCASPSMKRIPRNGAPRSGGRHTPSARSSCTPSGISPSPQALSSGGGLRSKTTAESPRRRAWIATASPTGPAPAIARSLVTARPRGAREGKARAQHLADQAQCRHRLGRVEPAGEEAAAGLGAPDLPARGARERPGLEHDHARRDEARPLGEAAADPLHQRGGVRCGVPRALHEDEQLLALAALRQDPDRRAAARAHAVEAIQGLLHVLRRVIAAPQHDRILATPVEIELASEEESRVAGIEPTVAKHFGGRRRQVVVALHDRGPAHADAPEPARGDLAARIVRDREREPGQRLTQADQRLTARRLARDALPHQHLAVERALAK